MLMWDLFCACVCVCVKVCLRLVDVGLIQDAMAAVCYNYLGARSHTHTQKHTETHSHTTPDYLIRKGLSD